MYPFLNLKTQQYNTKTFLYILVLLIILIFTLYGNTIKYDYAIDDDLVTQNHELVKRGLSAIPEIFTTSYYTDKKMQFGYRPMVLTSFAIEHQFFGQNPQLSHFINLLLYIVNCFLVFIILSKIFSKTHLYFLLFITVLFVVHPIHTEVVCNIKSRDELMSFAFSLLALWSAFKYFENKKFFWLPLIVMFFVAGVFSKQTTFSFLFVIPLSLYFSNITVLKKEYLLIVSILILGVVLAALPRFFLPPVEREIFFFENPLVESNSIAERLSMASYVLFFYIKKMVFPHPLSFYYGFNTIPIPSLLNPVVLSVLLLGIGCVYFIIKQIKNRHILSFALLYFVITLGMFLNLITPVAGIVAERFAYFASLGFCIFIACILLWFLRIKPENVLQKGKILKLFITALVVILPFSIKTKARSKVWVNHTTLYTNDIKHLENSALANSIYAELLVNEIYNSYQSGVTPSDLQKKLSLILKHYKRAIEVYDAYFSAYNNLAFIKYQFFGKYEEAIPLLERAITLRPDYTEAYFNLGYCHHILSNFEKAKENYKSVITLDASFYSAYSNLGEVYALMEEWEEALKINQKLIELLPENDLPYINLGKIFLMQGDTIQSMYNFEKAAEIAPHNSDLVYNLAVFYERRNETEKAAYYYSLLEKSNIK